MDAPTYRECTTCHRIGRLEQFSSDKNRRYGKKHECKGCNSVRVKAWVNANPERVKASSKRGTRGHLLRKYGMTPEAYNELLVKQNGVCAICRRKETSKDYRSDVPRRLAVDHCHTTGKVRGLLCSRCNLAIGKFEDDPVRIRAAALYVEQR